MGKTRNNLGFSAIEVILVVVIVALIGVVGWLALRSTSQPTSKKEQPAVRAPQPAEKPSQIAVITEADLKGKKFAAPRCGSDELFNKAPITNLSLKHVPPQDWYTASTAANGVEYESPDYERSTADRRPILKGAILWVSAGLGCTNGGSLQEDLKGAALGIANKEVPLTYIKVGNYYGAKFTHNSGENHNNHEVVVLFDGGIVYDISMQYNYDAKNPYPKVIDSVLESLK